ncbi:MAG: 4-hydroxy-tetrahydrodipicolinate reductase [Chitinophagaceae bacterium]|nr:MAG: 4-hydroxy-tetrahydrodipicolinate reductase [Chitinophagaceae bacterium]
MKIVLIGYGKMGKAIEEIALTRGHQILFTITHQNDPLFSKENLSQADVAIEFTNPKSAFDNVTKCFELGLPVVCGTTGWTERLDEIKTICNELKTAFLHATNFSVGVNLFFEINKKLASLMNTQSDYDIQISEIHHTQKKDSPSGTAVTLAEQILENISRKKNWINENTDNPDLLEIISKRIDPAAGTHKIKYSSAIDDIEIIHTAHSRMGFALGAVLAAEFIHKKTGCFTMKDVVAF